MGFALVVWLRHNRRGKEHVTQRTALVSVYLCFSTVLQSGKRGGGVKKKINVKKWKGKQGEKGKWKLKNVWWTKKSKGGIEKDKIFRENCKWQNIHLAQSFGLFCSPTDTQTHKHMQWQRDEWSNIHLSLWAQFVAWPFHHCCFITNDEGELLPRGREGIQT